MKTTNKFIAYFITILCAIISLGTAHGQPTNLPAPDLSMLSSHAALVGWAFKQVKGASTDVSSGAQANNWQSTGFFDMTNEVLSFDTITNTIGQYWWGLKTVATNGYINLRANLWNTNNYDAVNYYGTADQLFYAYGGGQMIRSPHGYWTLSAEDSQMQLNLASQIRIKAKGFSDARIITDDGYGNYWGFQVPGADGDSFWFPSDYAGNAILALTQVGQGADGYYYQITRAFDLKKKGVEVPLTQVYVQIILADSEDFRFFMNATNMSVTATSYGGVYGKVPMVMATYDTAPAKAVSLSVRSTDGQVATSYEVEDRQTNKKWTVTVTSNTDTAKIELGKGTYYIYPQGITLRLPFYWWYGGKG